MSTCLRSLEVAAKLRPRRRTVSPEGIFSKSKPGAKRRAGGKRALVYRRGESAGAELVVGGADQLVGAADQPTRRLRGALGEPVSAGLHRFQQYLRVDRFQYLRVAGGILQRAQITAPIAPIEKRRLQFSLVL